MFFAKKWNSIVELLWNFFVEVQVELLGNSISLYFIFSILFRHEKFSGSCIIPKPPLYEEVIALYKISFPHHEQREQASQCEILKNTDYHFEAICDEGCLIGKILYWCIEKLRYIEHFLYFTLYAKSTLRTEDPRSIAGRTLWN